MERLTVWGLFGVARDRAQHPTITVPYDLLVPISTFALTTILLLSQSAGKG